MSYTIHMSQTFQDQFRLLPKDQVPLITHKIEALCTDPRAESNATTQLRGSANPVKYRLRSGKWRVIYGYSADTIYLYRVGRRATIYRNLEGLAGVTSETYIPYPLTSESPPTGDGAPGPSYEHYRRRMRTWIEVKRSDGVQRATEVLRQSEVVEPTPLPAAITQGTLVRLGIPKRYHKRLVACHTDIDLLRALERGGVPEEIIDRVFNIVVDPDEADVVAQPMKQLKRVEDLARFHAGDLIDFQLALDADQRQIARSVLASDGPILIAGAAGTGKSSILLDAAITLALYGDWNGHEPRILISTYTRALVRTIRQQIARVCSSESCQFVVTNIDTLVADVLQSAGIGLQVKTAPTLQGILRRVVPLALQHYNQQQRLDLGGASGSDTGTILVGLAPVAGMTWEYLLEEIESVIVGRCSDDRDDYLTVDRRGRRVGLNETQRQAIWDVHFALSLELEAKGWTSFERARRRATQALTDGVRVEGYDAIFVDEAQDLSPNAIRMLMELHLIRAGEPRHFYLAADGNQTIYGHTVSWVSIHPRLNLTGRTRRLRKNHRTTQQIAEAARTVLKGAELESETATLEHINVGPRPQAVCCGSDNIEAKVIAGFFHQSCEEIRRDIADCAVLVLSEREGRRIQSALQHLGIEARFMSRDSVDLAYPGVKILTRHTAKGMEFPIVALSLRNEIQDEASPTDEVNERLARQHRLNHMAMTRAMRSLLVTLPADPVSIPAGIAAPLWDVRDFKHRNGH